MPTPPPRRRRGRPDLYPDLLISTCGGKPALVRNDGGNQNHWLQVKAIAAGQNREGIGTKVTVTANGMRQIGWIRSGSSFCSQHPVRSLVGCDCGCWQRRARDPSPERRESKSL